MVVRAARPEDAEGILRIYRPFVEATAVSFETEVPSVEEMQKRMGSGLPWLVADEGEVAAYAYAGPHRARGGYRFCVETSVYVGPSYRRRGLARLLYRELLDELRASGFVNVYAGIALPNEASIGLHTSLGFSLVGTYERIGFKFEEWHDVAWYSLRLGESE